jgi:ketosteroid isomerase-like protein
LTETTSVRELDEIRRRLEAAENTHDAQAFVDIMSDEVAVIVPDHPVQEGKAAAAEFVCGMTDWMRENLDRHITYVSTEVLEAADFAFDRGTFSFTVAWKKGGDRSVVRGKYFYVYRREARSWKIWRVIMSTDEDEEKVEVTT